MKFQLCHTGARVITDRRTQTIDKVNSHKQHIMAARVVRDKYTVYLVCVRLSVVFMCLSVTTLAAV